jgi:hypothetical protein
MSIFQQASRLKLRFETSKGSLSSEDLWDLPLTSTVGKVNLDDIAKALHKALKDSNTESFVVKAVKADEVLQLKFDIVKTIIDIKVAENEKNTLAREAKEKKQRILSLIAQKQDEQLAGTSLEELQKLADSL